MNLGGGSDRCWSVVGSDRGRISVTLLDGIRWISSSILAGSSRRILVAKVKESRRLSSTDKIRGSTRG
ncbi:hypothetical protein F2Q69_00012811 [Brassica cretica]|uniref:Uncharacterized protein n=1 Tax=Brassica cretica TaxID=69181 RepID=A0A8S9R628_BRACR|nr:hypothetical protein F2Q69_00012811 [Brassica cretica]